MTIGGLQKVTLVDYPGKLACTVFLTGCNFRCPFCYSKELVLEEEIKNHPQMSEDYFFNFLKEKKGTLEGCVVCGGEPTIHGEALYTFLRKIKKEGF
jgi:pyruvate formate lyase activating enzyme